MKILSNKKYNELLLKPLQNCFAQVDDDMLLRENGLLYAENKELHSIIKEAREKLEYLLTHDIVEINGTIYLKQEADDFITNYILEILDKESDIE